MSLLKVFVVGTFVKADQVASTGEIEFMLSHRSIAAAENLNITKVPVVAKLVNGSFSAELIATDQIAINPTNLTYRVTERIDGEPSRSYSIQVPVSASGMTIDLADIAPVERADPLFSSYTLQSAFLGHIGDTAVHGSMDAIKTTGNQTKAGDLTLTGQVYFRGGRPWLTILPSGNATTDTAAFVSAYATLAGLGGGVLHLLAFATYLYNATIDVPSNVVTKGCGDTTVIKAADNAPSTIQGFLVANRTGTWFEDLVFDLNKAVNPAGAGPDHQQALYFFASTPTGVRRCGARRVKVYNGHRDGIRIYSNADGNTLEVRLDDVESMVNGGNGCYALRTTRLRVVECDMSANGVSGLNIDGGSGSRVIGGRYDDNIWDGITYSATFAHTNFSAVSPHTNWNGQWGIAVAIKSRCFTITGHVARFNWHGGCTVDPQDPDALTVIQSVDGVIEGSVYTNARNPAVGHGFNVNYARDLELNGIHVAHNRAGASSTGIALTGSDITVTGGTSVDNSVGLRLNYVGTAVPAMGSHDINGLSLRNNGVNYSADSVAESTSSVTVFDNGVVKSFGISPVFNSPPAFPAGFTVPGGATPITVARASDTSPRLELDGSLAIRPLAGQTPGFEWWSPDGGPQRFIAYMPGDFVWSMYDATNARTLLQLVRAPAGFGQFTVRDQLAVQRGVIGQAIDLTQWQDETVGTGAGAVFSRVNKAGFYMTRKTTAPPDDDLVPSELAWWLDATNGASKAMFKAKSQNGTVVTGSVNLT